MPVDYALGRSYIESFMIDFCVITRDDQFAGDDTLNLTTGALEKPANDSFTVYSGSCLIKHINQKDLEFLQGQAPTFRKVYRALVPVENLDIKIGDSFVLTACQVDPLLIGASMRVNQVLGGTHHIYREIYLQHLSEDDNPTITANRG